jgi:hypothetical protein
MSIKLFIASTFWSADCTKSRMAADEIPCASGVLRGKAEESFSAAAQIEARQQSGKT